MGGYISGAHFNPALSIGAWIRGLMEGKVCVMYIISQCIGALCGTSVVSAVINAQITCNANGAGKVSWALDRHTLPSHTRATAHQSQAPPGNSPRCRHWLLCIASAMGLLRCFVVFYGCGCGCC